MRAATVLPVACGSAGHVTTGRSSPTPKGSVEQNRFRSGNTPRLQRNNSETSPVGLYSENLRHEAEEPTMRTPSTAAGG